MPPYRASVGGMFGSGMQPRGGGNIDIASAINAIGNQASSLVQSAYLRKVAERERAMQAAAQRTATEDKRVQRETEAQRRAEDVAFRNEELALRKAEAEARRTRTTVSDGQAVTIGPDGQATAAPIANFTPPVKPAGTAPNIDALSDAGIAQAVKKVRAVAAASPAGAVTGRAPTEAQEKGALFYGLMSRATGDMEALERSAAGKSRPLALRAAMGLWGGNYVLNDTEQAFMRSARDLAAGILRKESGAAITDGEIREVFARYIPMPGDSEATRKRKATARTQYMELMKQSALPAIRYYEAIERNGLPAADTTGRGTTRPPIDPDDPD